jgi:hypothetical protein
MARSTIDILEMINRKTKGNLDAEEQKLLDHILYELRLNFVDEQDKDRAGGSPDSNASNPLNSEPDNAENHKDS